MRRILCFTVLILLFTVNTVPVTSITGGEPEGWSEDIRLTFNDARSLDPAIAVEGNNVHVVYADNEGGGYLEMFLWYINSRDGGNTWNSPVCLVKGPSAWISSPKIAVNGSNIHVIWLEYNDRKIHYISSTDNGNTWCPERSLTPMAYHGFPNWDIGVYENNLHVVYSDSNHKLSYIQSNDNGISWSAPCILIPNKSFSVETAIAVSGSNVHIVWRDTKRAVYIADTFYIKSEDNGLTWAEDINISGTPMNHTYYVDVDVNSNNIYVVYGQAEENTRQVYYSYSEDNGKTWVRNIRLSNSTGYIHSPAIATEEKRIFVVWTDPREAYGHQVYFKSSSDGGKTWSNDIRLPYGTPHSTKADITTIENVIHVVWMDYRDGNEEIYYKQYLIPTPPVKATIDLNPYTLNLKSKGRWITTYIELPDGYDVNDIKISTILLKNTVPAENHPTEIEDYDNDGIPDLMIKFDRSDVEDMLTPSENTALTITGSLTTGESFEGTDTIRVI